MHPLDNPIWQALTTRQACFAEGSGCARKFISDVGPLTGFEDGEEKGYAALAGLLGEKDIGAVFLNQPYEAREGWECLATARLIQMVQESQNTSPPPDGNFDLVELGPDDASQMIALTKLTKPGPFGPRTHELGTYLGIRHGENLVAMAGERLKVPGFTEVSAVCTHPDYLGGGYAAALMSEIMHRIRERGEIPFLHAREDNARAIALYERLGFRTRWKGHFAVLRKIKDDVAITASANRRNPS